VLLAVSEEEEVVSVEEVVVSGVGVVVVANVFKDVLVSEEFVIDLDLVSEVAWMFFDLNAFLSANLAGFTRFF